MGVHDGPEYAATPSGSSISACLSVATMIRAIKPTNLDIESVAVSQIGDPLKLAALIEHVIEAAAKVVRTRRFIGRLTELLC